jgi:hypothetical protein
MSNAIRGDSQAPFALGKESGQMTIESVLVATVLLAITVAASQAFQKAQILQGVVGPWAYMRGMIENGIWETTTPNPAHPNAKARHASVNPATE